MAIHADTSGMDTKFVSITVATRYFGLPIHWLKAEATAGRIPHLKVGRRMLFDLAAVEQVLFDRAATTTNESCASCAASP